MSIESGRKDAGFLVWGMFLGKLVRDYTLTVMSIDLPDRNDFRPYSTIYEIDMLPSCQMS